MGINTPNQTSKYPRLQRILYGSGRSWKAARQQHHVAAPGYRQYNHPLVYGCVVGVYLTDFGHIHRCLR